MSPKMPQGTPMSDLPEHERLSTPYRVIFTLQQEREGERRTGIVVGADPTKDEFSWITLGMDHPVSRAASSLTRIDLPENAREFALLVARARDLGVHWGYKTYAQAAFALEQDYWPAGIFLLTIAARKQHAKLQEKRAIATLSLGLPFYEALPPHLRAVADAGSPEIKAIATAKRLRSKKIRLPNPSKAAEDTCAHEASTAIKSIVVEHPGFRAFAMRSLAEGRATAAQRRDTLTPPLQYAIVLGHEEETFFTVYGGRHNQMVVSEDGELRSLPAHQVEVDDDASMMADGGELKSILDYAWRDEASTAFWLGSGLASKLGNADADIFWMIYGARWQNKLGNTQEAMALLKNAVVGFLALDLEAMDRIRPRFTDLAEMARLYEGGGDISELTLGSVEELANHWEPAYSLQSMAKALYPEPGLFDGLVEVFSFGPAPFDKGALPPPGPGEPNPYGRFAPFPEEDGFDADLEMAEETFVRDELLPDLSTIPDFAPEVAAQPSRPAAAARETVEDAPPELAEQTGPAPTAPTVFCSDHCLLQTDWELPPGDEAFTQARDRAFAWLSEKIGTSIPPRWAEGANEAEHRGFRLETEAGEGLLAIRYEHPDHALVGRRWRAEIAIGQGLPGKPGVVAIRLHALDSTRLEAPTTATPRLVRDLVRAPGLRFGGRSAAEPWRISTQSEVQDLLARLKYRGRDYAVLVSPSNMRFSLPGSAAPLALQAQLDPSLLDAYTAAFEPIPAGHMHLYFAGANAPRSLPTGNPRAVEAALMQAHASRENLPPIPTFAEVRRRLRDLTITRHVRQAQASAATAAATSEEVTTMNELLEFLDGELTKTQAEKRALESDIDQISNELRDAKAALFAARSAPMPQEPVGAAAHRPAPPTQFSGMEGWLPGLTDRILVAPKAIREALSITDYQNEAVVLATLEAMHQHYWPMVFSSDAKAREQWQAFLKDHRLRCGPVGTASTSSRYEDAYHAVVDGRSYTMDLHIQGPSTRDIRRCLRIYFTTDKASRKVVIGIFPSHLRSTLT